MYRYCAEHAVNHRRIGKVIVACDDSELAGLEKYRRQAEINGCVDLRMLTVGELGDMEPEVRCVAGFLSPSTGIIDAHGLMLAYLGDLEAHGGALALASPVLAGRATGDDGILLEVGGQEPMSLLCRAVVNSAGFNAQAVARRIEGVPPASIPPTYYAIGHYYTLQGKAPFRRLIYPVARQDWLGVHVTIDLGGQVKFGPDFAWIDRIDYTFDESRKAAFYKAIRRYYPGLQEGALQPGYTGIRPKIHGPGEPAPDFMIQGPREHGMRAMVSLYGIESPGLTSSLAIADYVAELLGNS
jgi:L-2-hydroxyglutarate oxidase LhgO